MKSIGTNTLGTPRMTLRKLKRKDAGDLFAAGCLGESLQDAAKTVENMMQWNDDPMTFHWVLEFQGKAVGRIKGWEIDPRNNFIQLGYDIGTAFRGKGLMTEAVKAVSIYLLKRCEFNRVYCMVRESNPASIRVCEKAGMVREGILRNHWIQADGTYVNVYCFGILAQEVQI